MRDTRSWYRTLAKNLGIGWEYKELTPQKTLEIELGLFIISDLMPDQPVGNLWVLLEGYPFPMFERFHWTPVQKKMLALARHILTYYRSPYSWKQDLERYWRLPEEIRGFNLEQNGSIAQRPVTIAAERFNVYHHTLTQSLPYRRQGVEWAKAGPYHFTMGKLQSGITLPEGLVFDPPSETYPLNRRSLSSFSISWLDLLETARWMDQKLISLGLPDQDAKWEYRLQRVQLELFDETGVLRSSDQLALNGLLHLIGMVGAGKSTLMDVLTVWATQHDLHVTLVVGDVMNALNRAQLFDDLGIPVAPILGRSNRERHTNRLHRIVNVQKAPRKQPHVGFKWLSTACALDALRDHAKPLELGHFPCMSLYSNESDDDEEYTCPVFNRCPYHQAQRDLVNAKVWIATPASLVYSDVAPQITPSRLRFAELVSVHSDLVIIDEADQVQVQLDSIFSPSQTLISRGQDAWLGRLHQHVSARLNYEGRGQLSDEHVSLWNQTHDVAQAAANNVYKMLLQDEQLLGEMNQDYFTAWMIFNTLAEQITATADSDSNIRKRVMNHFEVFIADPLGERRDTPLAVIARLVLTSTNRDHIRTALKDWITALPELSTLDEQVIERYIRLLEFAILLEVLSNRLEILLRDWKHAEMAFQLDGASSAIFHRPPEDYQGVMPVAPMGNVLAYQYLKPLSGDVKEPGDLRVFRCFGIGRWLMLHFHHLLGDEINGGPHVILLSGTSWAGTSPRNHVQIPVGGILRSPSEEVRAITEESFFAFQPLYDQNGTAITISGKNGYSRQTALFSMLDALAQRQGFNSSQLSTLEAERDRLPEQRQRILLLVGSYVEAKSAREYLELLRPDWREAVVHLVADDDEFESQWQSGDRGLQRGMIHKLVDTEAWLLIAPLLAVERGHNILNALDQAAIGSVYFLIRPHPLPNDLSYAIHSINHWAIANYVSVNHNADEKKVDIERLAQNFRDQAFLRWRSLLGLPMVYSTLPAQERDAVTWSQMVTIWQVIGRLVRGGSPARVHFCDAAFAPQLTQDNEGSRMEASISLLVSMKRLLEPYFASLPLYDQQTLQVVQTLYGPFYRALERMEGFPGD